MCAVIEYFCSMVYPKGREKVSDYELVSVTASYECVTLNHPLS